MSQNPPQHQPSNPALPAMDFGQRPPSANWETVTLPECPQCSVWVWFKPSHVPFGLTITLPDQAWAIYPNTVGAPLTMRRLISAVGINPAFVTTWSLAGVPYDAMQGTNPLLDQPVPQPAPGVDPGIVVDLTPRQAFVPQPPMMQMPPMAPPQMQFAQAPAQNMPAPTGGAVTVEMERLFETIEKDWQSSKEGLRELDRLRKQLVDMHSRLKNLDRELNSNERRYSSSQDKKDWLEARRWLRDGMTKTLMLVKSYDIGDVSAAGRGRHVEELYTQYIETRTPFAGLESAHQQFIEYRKLVTTLQGKMSSAYTQAGVASERKAQTVMKRIQAKVRKGTTRKSFLDAISD